ncbi:MAG: aminoacyl-histidine dipeptidase [Prevotellaceae bacterium]|jgi:dipeptidase D|nr:aminoacyl-histidine dipeptidase [Prevotellaceae bacterium]
MTIADLNPKRVWKHFYALTQIPRPSGHEEKVVTFIKKFGEDLGLETIVDHAGNVIIRKPATSGMEGRCGIILQAHLDMVPQKNSDKVHDFEKDPIEPRIVGEWVYATGTTLGADNGLGMAAAMAVLEAKDLVHGPIEALFTAEEETGMTGARELKGGVVKGDILINLDSEDEGELYVGCAGGLDGTFTFGYKEEPVPANMAPYSLNVTGLKGGHSGMDIVLYRGNANKLITRLLLPLLTKFGVRLSSIEGGSLRNAIPREAFAKVVVPKDKITDVEAHIKTITAAAKAELSIADPDVQVALVAESTPPAFVMDAATAITAVRSVIAAFNGVFRMSDSMPGLVETSNNLAIVKSEDGKIWIKCLMRSSVDSAKEKLAQTLGATFALAGANTEFSGGYSGWRPNMDSPILKKMKEIYQKMFGVEPQVKAIHAGLECGILGGNYPHWDMISCGPTLRSPHSPDERALIPTVEKWWDFLVEVLKNAPTR